MYNDHMRSIAINNIGYTGVVKLSQYTNGKKFSIAEIHNAGGKPLFDFLANCLAGDIDLAKRDRPTQILLLNIEKTDSGEVVVRAADNTGFLTLLSKPERVYSETAGVVRYRFIIPQEYFAAGTSNGAVRFNAIGLYPSSVQSTADAHQYAAYCEVDTDGWSLSAASVLVLDWELHIANSHTTKDTEIA